MELFFDLVTLLASGAVGYGVRYAQVARETAKAEKVKADRKKKTAEKAATKRRAAATDAALAVQAASNKPFSNGTDPARGGAAS